VLQVNNNKVLTIVVLTYGILSTRFFRTLGLRHVVVLDGDHCVTGIITRHDLTEHRLEHHWFQEGDNMQKFISVDSTDAGTVVDNVRPADDDDAMGLMEGGIQLKSRSPAAPLTGDTEEADSFSPLTAQLPIPPPLSSTLFSSGMAGNNDGTLDSSTGSAASNGLPGGFAVSSNVTPTVGASAAPKRSKVLKEPKSMKPSG
jgi:hypothetical protein